MSKNPFDCFMCGKPMVKSLVRPLMWCGNVGCAVYADPRPLPDTPNPEKE